MKARSYQANIIPITDWTKRRKQRTFFLASDRFSIFFPYWWCECCAVCASSLLIPLVNNKSITNDNPCAFSHCQAHLFPSCLCNGVWWMCHYFDVWVWNLAARKCVFSHWACVCVCLCVCAFSIWALKAWVVQPLYDFSLFTSLTVNGIYSEREHTNSMCRRKRVLQVPLLFMLTMNAN